MLELKTITSNTEEIKAKLATRGFDITIIDRISELGTQRSEVMSTLQQLEAKRNELSKSIGKVKSEGGDSTQSCLKFQKLNRRLIPLKMAKQKLMKKLENYF